jgi:hypothetical protein
MLPQHRPINTPITLAAALVVPSFARRPRHAPPADSIRQPPTASAAQGSIPLHFAVRSNQPLSFKRLLQKGADIEATNDVRGQYTCQLAPSCV